MGTADTAAKRNAFHIERSRFLDAFAALERALLANRPASDDDSLTDRIQALRAIRNDLVHCELRFTQLGGELQAIAVNTQNLNRPARPARILRLADFDVLKTQIGHLKQASGTRS